MCTHMYVYSYLHIYLLLISKSLLFLLCFQLNRGSLNVSNIRRKEKYVIAHVAAETQDLKFAQQFFFINLGYTFKVIGKRWVVDHWWWCWFHWC